MHNCPNTQLFKQLFSYYIEKYVPVWSHKHFTR